MSCCYEYPRYRTLCCSPCYRTICYSPCYRTVRRSRTCSYYNPCSLRTVYNCRRRYSCGDCCSYRTSRTTRYYYPSTCCNYSYRCCYPCL